jgi:hypothetical protein
MSTIKDNAERRYTELADTQKSLERLEQQKTHFEIDAKAAREDEAKAKDSVSAALVRRDDDAAAAFRKIAREGAELQRNSRERRLKRKTRSRPRRKVSMPKDEPRSTPESWCSRNFHATRWRVCARISLRFSN